MAKLKLTPWFSAHVKPARVGVYQRQTVERTPWYAYWDGTAWLCGWNALQPLAYMKSGVYSMQQEAKWRGVLRASSGGAS